MKRLFAILTPIALALTGVAAFCDSSSPPANCDRVANPSTFASQYAATTTGQTLCLDAGLYGDVTIDKSMMLANSTTTRPTLRTLRITASDVRAHALEVTGGGDPLVTVAQGVARVTVENSKIHDGTGNGVRNRGDYVTFDNNELYHFASEDAFRFWGDHHTYRNNYIHDVANPGHNDAWQSYQTSAGDAPVTNLVMDGNRVYNFSGSNAHCIIVSGSGDANWTITNNQYEQIGAHCTILGLHPTDPGASANEGVANVRIDGNTYTDVGGTAIECDGNTYGSITNNTFTRVGGTVYHADNSNCTGQ